MSASINRWCSPIRGCGAKLLSAAWFWYGLALLGLAVYTAEALYFAHHQRVVFDEGTYLYKGWLFARGVYRPFQAYGPWTNHMPLAFLIPGWVQRWLGPGLQAGRYFQVALSVIMWGGVWLLLRRWAGLPWAAWGIWAAAAMPVWAKVYSLAISEGLTAAVLIWALAAFWTRRPRGWQVVLGGALTGGVVLIRLNMAAALLFFALMVGAIAGRRAALRFLAAAALVVAVGHALYWPEILRLWVKWLPARWTPFLDAWRLPAAARPAWHPSPSPFYSRLFIAATTWQDYALAWSALLGATFALRGRRGTRAAVGWLVALLWVLALSHAAVSVGQNWCVDCLSIYASFFMPLSLVALGAACASTCRGRGPRRLWWALGLTAALTAAAVGIGSDADILQQVAAWGDALLPNRAFDTLRLLSLRAMQKTHTYTGWPPRKAQELLLGLTLGALAVAGVALLRRSRPRRSAHAWLAWVGVLTLLSPTSLLSGHFTTYDCRQGDVLQAVAATGQALRDFIPPGSTVYWQGYSVVPLLYVPQIRTFPPQYNGVYGRREGAVDSDTLRRWGLWNGALAQQWLRQANVVVIEQAAFHAAWQQRLAALGMQPVGQTPPPNPCQPTSRLLVFRRGGP